MSLLEAVAVSKTKTLGQDMSTTTWHIKALNLTSLSGLEPRQEYKKLLSQVEYFFCPSFAPTMKTDIVATFYSLSFQSESICL